MNGIRKAGASGVVTGPRGGKYVRTASGNLRSVQHDVSFTNHKPAIHKSNEFAQYHLNKQDIGKILKDWPHAAKWEPKLEGKAAVSSTGFHGTTRFREKLSQPLREFLDKSDSRSSPGRVLYHGVGRDDVGANALKVRGQVVKYDPYHPDPDVRKAPQGKFGEVHSHYTLNVVDKAQGKKILQEIHDSLEEGGKAIITVRRDLDKKRVK